MKPWLRLPYSIEGQGMTTTTDPPASLTAAVCAFELNTALFDQLQGLLARTS